MKPSKISAVLRACALLALLALFGGNLPAQADAIFLTDSGAAGDGTKLFSVSLGSGVANLTLLTTLPASGYDQVDAIATLYGDRLYFVDRDSRNLGYVDISGDTAGPVTTVGQVGVAGSSMLAFSPTGILYLANQSNERLYTVNTATAATTLVGTVNVDLVGADLAFSADGTLYLWTNSTSQLYTVNPSTAVATLVGGVKRDYTGLAMTNFNSGNLLGSQSLSTPGKIFELTTVGADVTSYTMKLGDQNYSYRYGDMASAFQSPNSVVPLPGAVLLLGVGLLRLTVSRRGRS